jgi:chemotaxis protein histidine kinase CheA
VESLEFDEKWQQLKARFKERLVVRFSDMDVAWSALVQDPADLSALSALFHLVHSLAGSGATFGFESLSERARQLEPLIDPQLEAGRKPLEGERRASIARALELIRAEAHQINEQVKVKL